MKTDLIETKTHPDENVKEHWDDESDNESDNNESDNPFQQPDFRLTPVVPKPPTQFSNPPECSFLDPDEHKRATVLAKYFEICDQVDRDVNLDIPAPKQTKCQIIGNLLWYGYYKTLMKVVDPHRYAEVSLAEIILERNKRKKLAERMGKANTSKGADRVIRKI